MDWIVYPVIFGGNMEVKELAPKRTDCIFYSEIQDMHALIPQCKLCSEFAECPCKPDCESYAPNAMALKARGLQKYSIERKE